MPEPAGPTQPEAGFFEHARALLGASSSYLRARLHLAGLESKEALVHYGIIIGLAVAAVAILVFGYLFLCLALMVLIAHALRIHPGWMLLIFAAVHFVAAIVCLLIAKTKLTTPMFAATLHEFKKDEQWLTSKTN